MAAAACWQQRHAGWRDALALHDATRARWVGFVALSGSVVLSGVGHQLERLKNVDGIGAPL